MILLAPAQFGSHFFGGGLHESRIEVAGVFGANVLATHTTDTTIFIGFAGISFVDRAHRTTEAQIPHLSQASLDSGLKGMLVSSLYEP